MVAVGILPEHFVEQVGGPVDDQMLLDEIRRRIHAAEHLDHLQSIQSAVPVSNRLQYLDGTLPGRFVALGRGQTGPQFSLGIADMPRRDELVAALDAQVQVTRLLLRKRDLLFAGPLFGAHAGFFRVLHFHWTRSRSSRSRSSRSRSSWGSLLAFKTMPSQR